MHRHGYKGRKFGREKDQRNALIRGLMIELVKNQSIKTTLPKAKELRRPMEKVITKAKKGDLANRRAVISKLGNVEVASLLVDTIAPQIERNSGYLRIVKLDDLRRGDGAPMARIEFVDEIVITNNETAKEEASKPESSDQAAADRKDVKEKK